MSYELCYIPHEHGLDPPDERATPSSVVNWSRDTDVSESGTRLLTLSSRVLTITTKPLKTCFEHYYNTFQTLF